MYFYFVDGLDKAEKSVADFFRAAPSLTYDDRQKQFDKIKEVPTLLYSNILQGRC